ncbi:hypothetical protein [Pontiella agarivorans]|uniref:Uncharacterized protein n=1 Tax=Pontiella agarivorans TaxID=3038953 RepID=A0ABU5MS22_9BACT|nr:hypothetical protein [Pontiella agarivorans]MDZ8116995.1 hypothetical protein [Pontiella agarivorans]
MKPLQITLLVIYSLILIPVLYGFWTYLDTDRIDGPSSPTEIKTNLKMREIHGLIPEYKTTLTLTPPNWDRHVYYFGKLREKDVVEEVHNSMTWIDGNTLSFVNKRKKKKVVISYTNGLWNLTEYKLNHTANHELQPTATTPVESGKVYVRSGSR